MGAIRGTLRDIDGMGVQPVPDLCDLLVIKNQTFFSLHNRALWVTFLGLAAMQLGKKGMKCRGLSIKGL